MFSTLHKILTGLYHISPLNPFLNDPNSNTYAWNRTISALSLYIYHYDLSKYHQEESEAIKYHIQIKNTHTSKKEKSIVHMVEWIKPPKNQNFLSYPIRKSNTQKNPGIYFLEMKCLLPAEIDDSGEKKRRRRRQNPENTLSYIPSKRTPNSIIKKIK